MSRIVMFVLNDCRTDVRVIREAASLVRAGREVTVMARPTDLDAIEGDREERDGFTIVRVPITTSRIRRGLLSMSRSRRGARPTGDEVGSSAEAVGSQRSGSRLRAAARGTLAFLRSQLGGFVLLARWRWSYRSWAKAAAIAAGPADVYHGHDLRGLAAAEAAHRRHGGRLVYDSHELFLETGAFAGQPGWARRTIARLEREWGHRADGLISVNRSIADILGRRLAIAEPVVVMNCPPRREPSARATDRLRAAVGVAAGTPIVLYHGGFLADRGLPEAIEAMARPVLKEVHLVLLGWGPERSRLASLAARPAVLGRVHLLDAVAPDELADWVETADVGIMVNQPRTLNERLSSPNKLFECLAVGVPVVSSDFAERHRIVVDDPDGPLGAVCDPTDPDAIAAAISSILGLDPAARADLRQRCLRAAHDRYCWETQESHLLDLYARLAPLTPSPTAASSTAAQAGLAAAAS
jgi:glycosyltransferase involved in cell wall biosynthesis